MSDWVDLAPDIVRQRIVIEGTLWNVFTAEKMNQYCRGMTKVLNMTEVTAPFCNHDPNMDGARMSIGKKWDARLCLG